MPIVVRIMPEKNATTIITPLEPGIAISTNFTCTPLVLSSFCMIVFYCTPLMLYEYWLERKNDLLALMKSSWQFQSTVYVYLFGMLLLFHPIVTGKFIYFQF